MDYHIECEDLKGRWSRIASFKHLIDRDDCLSFLADRYDDVKFKAKNEEE